MNLDVTMGLIILMKLNVNNNKKVYQYKSAQTIHEVKYK